MQALRAMVFRPYRKGLATFRLETWTTGSMDERGQSRIAYKLTQVGPEMRYGILRRDTIFHGTDFCGSPLHADDSDATMAILMNFLTLRPGDTDADYFKDYTDAQKAFCQEHAEALSMEVTARLGEV
jgi:hypothetical protein